MEVSSGVCAPSVFNRLYKEHANALFKYLYYKFGSESNAKDLTQEAFLKLWDKCKDVAPEKARGFLFTVASNQMLNDLAKAKTALNYAQHSDGRTTTPENPQFILEEQEFMQRLQAALGELSEDLRVTFLLNRVEGKKHQEIADMLGISRKAVEKRIYKALDILRSQLAELKKL